MWRGRSAEQAAMRSLQRSGTCDRARCTAWLRRSGTALLYARCSLIQTSHATFKSGVCALGYSRSQVNHASALRQRVAEMHVQVLSQAAVAQAPYALLSDGSCFMFFHLQACMDEQGVVLGWHLRYLSKSLLSRGPSIFQIMHRLLSQPCPPRADWPALSRMRGKRHPGCPVSHGELQRTLRAWPSFL